MKRNFLRLDSIVEDGVASHGEKAEVGMIEAIYTFLLEEEGLYPFSYIHINQISLDMSETIHKQGNQIFVGIHFNSGTGFRKKSSHEKNLIRLEIIHAALLRISKIDERIVVSGLERIRKKILDNDFDFNFIIKEVSKKSKHNLIGRVMLHPCKDKFEFYAEILENEVVKCRVLLYKSVLETFGIHYLFSKASWESSNEFLITGNESEVNIVINIINCNVDFIAKKKEVTDFKIFNSFKW